MLRLVPYERTGTPDETLPIPQGDPDRHRRAERKLLAEKDVPKDEAESLRFTIVLFSEKQVVEDRLYITAAAFQ